MDRSKQVSSPTYKTLKSTVLALLAEGRERAARAVDREKASTYWEIGHTIHTHLEAHGGASTYGDQVVKQLASDAGLKRQRFYEMLSIYRTFPIVRTSGLLGWSHYIELVRLQDDDQRTFYEAAASKRGWSVRELRAQIKTDIYGEHSEDAETGKGRSPLTPVRGELYTYTVLDVNRDAVVIDLGFGIDREIPKEDVEGEPAVGDVGRSTRVKDRMVLSPIDAPDQTGRFTYTADVVRVVDGDTLRVRVDLGFRTGIRHILRLRGIDTPELSTEEGTRAKAYVQRVIADSPIVAVRTFGKGRYGRYVTDVFISEGETDRATVVEKGRYLNQVLVERGLARRI